MVLQFGAIPSRAYSSTYAAFMLVGLQKGLRYGFINFLNSFPKENFLSDFETFFGKNLIKIIR